jgi:lysophospholipase L1-like esterase
MTAFAPVTGAFRVRAFTVHAIASAPLWLARPWLAAALGAVVMACLALIDVLRFRASGAPGGPAGAIAAGSTLAVTLAWHEALRGRVTTFALVLLALVAALTIVLFLARRWPGARLRWQLALSLLLVALAVPPLIARATEFPEERANELPFYAVTGPRFPADLAWYFHPLVRRFNSFLADHTFRRQPHAIACEPGTVRIACLGTSSTWGYPLPPGEEYPAQLGALLGARGVPAEVLNAAVPGSTTFRLTRFFEGVVREFRPQIVTISLFFNDSSSCLQYDEEALLAEITREDFAPSWLFRLRQNLALRRAQEDYERARQIAGDARRRDELSSLPIVQQGLRRFGSHLAALVTSARASGANVLLIKEPARAEAFLREPMHGVIDEVGRTLGVEVLDVEVPLAERLGESGFVDWIHPTKAGHELIAELVAERLQALGWLTPR